MKKIKKLLAMIMAMTMVLGMAMTVSAADVPKDTDCLDVTGDIEGVEAGATITAYQIIDAVYNEYGFVKYRWVAGNKAGEDVKFDSNGDVIGLTDTYITGLASNKEDLTSTTNLKQLPVGTWMLIVTGSNLNKVYNPMIISVYYTSEGVDAGEEVDADDVWGLATNGAYVKSSDIPNTKTVNDANAAVGDTVTFTIRSEFPSYSESSTAKFVVTDTIKNGLAYATVPETDPVQYLEPVVRFYSVSDLGEEIDGAIIPEDNYELSYDTDSDGNAFFTIDFDATYLKTLAEASKNRKFKITYDAVITDDAITEIGENESKIEYDNGQKVDTEYTYTVSFDGIAKKVGEGEDEEGLSGATFTLYKGWVDANDNGMIESNEATLVQTVTTDDASGNTVDFKGLDADETYYLVETAAPSGYTVNTTVYTITFDNVERNEQTGVVTYDVIVNGAGDEKSTTVTYGQKVDTPVVTIENTKLHRLPSTGGIGTTIFTIGGCAIMIAAAALYFVNRRKSEEN